MDQLAEPRVNSWCKLVVTNIVIKCVPEKTYLHLNNKITEKSYLYG